MEKRFNFTQARIRDLPLPEIGRLDYSDTDINKLVCRVSSTGNKSFLVTKRVDGKLKNVTIGKFPDVSVTEARLKAQEILTALNSGINPTEEKRKKAIAQTTLSDVLEQYLSERDLKPYTVKNYRYKLKLGFNDWLNKPVNSITEDMILKRHKKISQTGKTTANTTMRVLRLTLNYADAVGMINGNPASILSKARLWHRNKRKEVIIPSTQLKDWHDAVTTLSNQKAKVYFLILLYMGFRSTETLEIEWCNVDLTAKTLKLVDTKNRTDRTFPIPEPLIKYLKELQSLTGDYKWVFVGRNLINHMSDPRVPMKKVIQRSNVVFSAHVCRHTFTTIAEANYLPDTLTKRLTNHKASSDVTAGYIHTEDDTLRIASNKIADYIQARITQKDNVIQLHANK
tara:strand:+ start:210 stop:1403 length:1194 start_codon:yes stop_codon:yes gene_type:complete